MNTHVCPWYIGYLLASPLRRLVQNPEAIIKPYVTPGIKILEVGPGMGFFTLPMARIVGQGGLVVCVDIQEKMLASLRRRAVRAGLSNRIEARLCAETSLQIDNLSETIDFSLAYAVVHEVQDPTRLFREIFASLKKGGSLLLSEPKGHVTAKDFENTLSIARSSGFQQTGTPIIKRSHSAVLVK